MADGEGQVNHMRAYDPYGVVRETGGTAQTDYAFTNEYMNQGLVYLRARYYSPTVGRFLTRDPWRSDFRTPISMNKWLYVESNPVNNIDPSGFISIEESADADKIVEDLYDLYKVRIIKDWGYVLITMPPPALPPLDIDGDPFHKCEWQIGN